MSNILESDIISKKICHKCFKNMQKIHEIVQMAIRQDQSLKDKCHQYLEDKGMRLPNTSVTIKKDVKLPCKPEQQVNIPNNVDACVSSNTVTSIRPPATIRPIKGIHPSIIDVYRKYPKFKLPKKCIERHMAPIVSLAMDEVETYFIRQRLDINKYIYRPTGNVIRQSLKNMARKKTAAPTKPLSSLKIRNSTQNDVNSPRSSRPGERTVINDPANEKINESVTVENLTSKAQSSTILNKNLSGSGSGSIYCVDTGKVFQENEVCQTNNCESSPITSNCLPNGNTDCTPAPPPECLEPTKTNRQGDSKSNRLESPSIGDAVRVESSCIDTSHLEAGKTAKRKTAITSSLLRSSKMIKNKPELLESSDTRSDTLPSAITESSNLPVVPSPPTIALTATKDPSPQATASEDANLPSTSKPEFIQSLGLTPAIAAQTRKSILICKICGSLQQNVAALKKHNSRHRICPFCKLKFKSVETKQNHIDSNCETKKIIEAPESFVSLDKVEGNLELREKYTVTFSAVGLIPEIEGSSELVNDDLEELDDVIVLSDGEESELTANGNDSSVQEIVVDLSKSPPSSSSEESKTESVSVVRPIVSIHNNTVLNQIRNSLSDKRLIKDVLSVLKARQDGVEQFAQIGYPCNQDLTINRNDTCRLKKLKGNLWSYEIPVTIHHGSFSVSYKARTEVEKTAEMADWNDLPIVEKRTRSASQEISLMNATYPLTFLTSQVQSSQLSLQLMTATPTMSIFLPNTSTFIPGAGLSLQPGINNTGNQTQTINFSPITSTTSLQTTPLLQNYTLSMTPLPLINNQVPIQTTTTSVNNSPASNEDGGSETTVTSSTGSNSVSSTTTIVSSSNSSSSKKSLPSAALSKSNKTAASPRRSLPSSTRTPSKVKFRAKKRLVKVKGNLASATSTRSSKLRVKNIWELK